VKEPANGLAAKLQTPVFPQTLHSARPNQPKPVPVSSPGKRHNVFAKPRDAREALGGGKMKTANDNETKPAG
jgi:hypothetical protein